MRQTSKALLAILAFTGVAGISQAQMPPSTPLEGSVETTTDAVILPADLHGRVTVRGCEGCEYSTLQLNEDTQINVGGHMVGLRELSVYLHRVSGRPVTINYRLSDHIVSRIWANEQ